MDADSIAVLTLVAVCWVLILAAIALVALLAWAVATYRSGA